MKLTVKENRRKKEIEKTEKDIQRITERNMLLQLIKSSFLELSTKEYLILKMECHEYGNFLKLKKKKKLKMSINFARKMAEKFGSDLELLESACFTQSETGFGANAIIKTHILLVYKSIIGYNDTLISTLRWENRNSFDTVAQIQFISKEKLVAEIDNFFGINSLDCYYLYNFSNISWYIGEVYDFNKADSFVADLYYLKKEEKSFLGKVYDNDATNYSCYTILNFWIFYLKLTKKKENVQYLIANYNEVVSTVKREFPKQLTTVDFAEIKLKHMKEAIIKIKEYYNNEY